MKRTPLLRFTRMRQRRTGPARRGRTLDPQYLAWLRRQACAIDNCQRRDIEAAHVGPRGYGARCHDAQAIPLCSRHHRTGKDAQHVLGRGFWGFHALDRWETIRKYRRAYEAAL